MRRLQAAFILVIAVLWFVGPTSAAMYKWTDENGVLHIVTSLEDVPEKYRDQVLKEQPAPTAAPQRQPAEQVPAASAEPATEAPAPGEPQLLRFEIPYENEGSARRVIIPVKFNDYVVAPMALDTGSPGMVISVELAVRLGVFSQNNGTLLTEAAGIGGSTLAVLTIVDSVSVDRARSVFVPTTVTAGISDKFDGLIGMDFLANYTISIDSRNQVVVFQEEPPQPGSRGGHDEAWWRGTFENFRAAADRWREVARSSNRRPGTDVSQFLEFQARESERLLQKLDLYASDNAVPRHWR